MGSSKTLLFGAMVLVSAKARAQLPEPAPAPTPVTTPTPMPEPAPTATPTDQPAGSQPAVEAPPEKSRATMELYGFVMVDTGYDFGDVGDPAWFDTLRPTKLPSVDDQFAEGGRTFAGVRQTRFGVKSTIPTDYHGDVKTTFEFEMFGVGVDEGQTTIRLRHAVGDWWQLRAGQTWSPFMDIDVFPNSVEYWGPNGMAFFRNVQVAWMPIQGDSRVTIALERPGASADTSNYADRIELDGVVARFPMPDISAEGRWGGDWGYVEAAGILRYMRWDDVGGMPTEIEGHAWGAGVSLSSNIKLPPALLKLQAVFGKGIQNYMNDAGADIGPETTGDPLEPIEGKAMPMLGLVGFVDFNWSERWTSSFGYSMVWIDNTDGQGDDAFHIGHYALGNIMFHPSKTVFFGPELQWGRRESKEDFSSDDVRLQVSFQYKFSHKLIGE